MADQTQSARFQNLFESALEAYEKKTGIKLAQHPLSMGLQNCNPVGSITAFLLSQAPAFSDFTENDRIMGLIKVTVWILTALSAIASLSDAFSPVRQKALMACFTSPSTFFTDTVTCERDIHWPRYPTCCMYRSLVNVSVSL